MRDYNLTESICHQAVVVSTKLNGWTEWFSNPTAGPWKRIGIPGVSSLAGTGFEQLEKRPDLMLYHKSAKPKVLIIECKDKIDKLIDSANQNDQIKKTCQEVLPNMKTRLYKLIKTSEDKELVQSLNSINFIPGYVIGDSKDIQAKISELNKLHFKFIDKSVFPYFIIMIVKKSGLDLRLETQINYETQTNEIKELEKFFQTGI